MTLSIELGIEVVDSNWHSSFLGLSSSQLNKDSNKEGLFSVVAFVCFSLLARSVFGQVRVTKSLDTAIPPRISYHKLERTVIQEQSNQQKTQTT